MPSSAELSTSGQGWDTHSEYISQKPSPHLLVWSKNLHLSCRDSLLTPFQSYVLNSWMTCNLQHQVVFSALLWNQCKWHIWSCSSQCSWKLADQLAGWNWWIAAACGTLGTGLGLDWRLEWFCSTIQIPFPGGKLTFNLDRPVFGLKEDREWGTAELFLSIQ